MAKADVPEPALDAGDSTTFDGAGSSDLDGSITGYTWNFGDGTTAQGAVVSHVYAAGTYAVTLTDDAEARRIAVPQQRRRDGLQDRACRRSVRSLGSGGNPLRERADLCQPVAVFHYDLLLSCARLQLGRVLELLEHRLRHDAVERRNS